MLQEDRETIEREIKFLVEPKALTRITWPGLYLDHKSQRYNFHRDWIQERLRYPWPYEKDYYDLRRLLTGCVHIGYNTTDYEFIRWKFLDIIRRFDIQVLEICGDVIAGLKHDMIHQGQIMSALNYTEQAVFAAEIFGTIIYERFMEKFDKLLGGRNPKTIPEKELELLTILSLICVLVKIGNHDAWVAVNGEVPLFTFCITLVLMLRDHLDRFLWQKGVHTPNLGDIILSKIILLPEHNAVYEFEGGLRTELLHPHMPGTKTGSLRLEDAVSFSRNCQLVDLFNFHTAICGEFWRPELGQIVAVQGGAMCLYTGFEANRMKRLDFGPVYSRVLHKNGRIFTSEHMFFNKPTPGFTDPLPVHIDANQLKEKLKLLRSPVSPDEKIYGKFRSALEARLKE